MWCRLRLAHWQRYIGGRDGGGRGDNPDIHGDGDAGRIFADAALSALSLSGMTLSPAFASGVTVEYTASVANSVTETTVMASARATPMPAWR